MLILAASAAAAALTSQQEDYSNLKVGASWTFRTQDGQEITWSVAKKEQKAGRECLRVEIKTPVRTNIEWIQVTSAGEFLVAKDRYSFDPPYPRLKFPSKIGDQWEVQSTQKSEVENDAEVLAHYDVIGTEDVDVPAGHWTCLKVNFSIKRGAGEVTGTHWRADGVGLVKISLEPGGVLSLAKYSAPK